MTVVICRHFATENNKWNDSNIFTHFKVYETETYTFGSLKTPHESIYNFIYKLDKIFTENVASSMLKYPGNTLYALFQQVEYKHMCPNFPINYFLNYILDSIYIIS